MPKVSGIATEKQLNWLFETKIRQSDDFVEWFLGRTKFRGRSARLVLARADNPWYRSKKTGKGSETDVLLVFEDRISGQIFALHIENKLSGGSFTHKQPEIYYERAEDWKNTAKWGDYSDYDVILIAPRRFYDTHKAESDKFGSFVPHEDIAEYITEFAANLLPLP
jgi:hypothetical protein